MQASRPRSLTNNGYVLVTKDVSIANGAGAGTAVCPTGYVVVTGGAAWHDPGSSTLGGGGLIESSTPTKSGTGWYAAGRNESGETFVLHVIAQCLSKAAVGPYTVKSRDIVVDPQRPGNATLRCPVGQWVVSGGAAWHLLGKSPSGKPLAYLTATFPETNSSWTVVGRNDAASDGPSYGLDRPRSVRPQQPSGDRLHQEVDRAVA